MATGVAVLLSGIFILYQISQCYGFWSTGTLNGPPMGFQGRQWVAGLRSHVVSSQAELAEGTLTDNGPESADLIRKDSNLESVMLMQPAGSPEKAEEMLRQRRKPSLLAYNNCLKAWKEAGNSERALKLLNKMDEEGIANTVSFTIVISALAQDGTKMAAHQANELMEKRMLVKDSTVKPNTHTFNSVIHAWVQCGNVKRAEQVLRVMESSLATGPNVVSYSTVMGGWAKSNDKDALTRAKDLFQKMEKAYERGNAECKPNLFSYVTLINAYCRSQSESGAIEAQKLLFRLYDEYREGNGELKPSAQLVTSVIQCWANSGARNSGDRAETLLRWLMDCSSSDVDMQPNEFTFSSVITAHAKSRRLGKAAMARGILNEMISLHKSGTLNVTPNTHCYTAVINSCAYCENDALDKNAALKIAVATYKELRADLTAQSNPVTYATFLTALRNLLPASPERSRATRDVLSNAADDGCVSDLVLQRVQTILTTGELKQLLPSAVSKDGKIDTSRLPAAWREHTCDVPLDFPMSRRRRRV